MKKYTIQELKTEFIRLNYKWFNFQFIGIRSKANLPNQFDDLFILIDGDKINYYTCTTNAGTHWLKNLLNPKGCAVLVPNQYVDTWKIGLHQGKYKAFVQNKEVSVYRDKNKNDIAEETLSIERGLFGINIHRANEKFVSKLVDKWSAGCQVLNSPSDFMDVLTKAERSQNKYFTYTLLKEY
jgi:hypothetical protein